MRYILMVWMVVAAGAVMAQESEPARRTLSEATTDLQAARHAEAIEGFLAVLKIDATNRVALFGLGTAYIELEQFAKGLDVLEPMLENNPEDPLIQNNVAWALIRVKDPRRRDLARATRLAQRAVMQLPDEYSVWGTLTEVYYSSSHFDRALNSARVARDLARRSRLADLSVYQELVARCEKAARAIDIVDE